MRNEEHLPPIITYYINKINDKSISKHQKDIYCIMLERIRDACNSEIKKHNGRAA
jgi:hypothetical protein